MGLTGTDICVCMKRHYCAGCDAMHPAHQCPRTVLDAMNESLFFKEQLNLKRLIEEILDSAEARVSAGGRYTTDHIKSRIDELADRHGNLGVTRKKLLSLANKALRQRWNRYRRESLRRQREENRAKEQG
ncbi:MAG: hypothetical protein AB7V39_26690 [Nitrospiraceae bacterium]